MYLICGTQCVQVSVGSLQGGTFGLYFSASSSSGCRGFTTTLIEAYNQLSSEGNDFEVIFVSGDRDENSFNDYFAKMPWLAIPFSDSDDREQLNTVFKVYGIPHLVIIDANGKVLIEDAVDIVGNYGADAYPFTLEKQNELRKAEKAARRNQTLRSVLVSPSRDYVISSDGTKVPVSDLEGKIVAIYFFAAWYTPSVEFAPIFAQIYEKLKERGEKFEVVMVYLDGDESSFVEVFSSMPWLALPFEGTSRERVASYFTWRDFSFVVIIGADGETMRVDFVDIVEEHGVEALEALPFNPEKLELLAEKAKAKLEAQTLESLLISGDQDFVIGKENVKVPVKDLAGKYILLYFSAQYRRDFLPKLVEGYREIKNKDDAFEIIFISSDSDHSSFGPRLATRTSQNMS